jgi:hypothetical protein
MINHGLELVAGHNDRQMLGFPGADNFAQFAAVATPDMATQEPWTAASGQDGRLYGQRLHGMCPRGDVR